MIESNISLQPYNTLGVDVKSRWFVAAKNREDLLEALDFSQRSSCDLHVLGGGSNVVFTQDFDGLIVLMAGKGKVILSEQDDKVRLRVAAGETWHDFVEWCLAREFYGLENLALIPGTVGAAPIQNIGAYGVEVKQYIEAVHVVDRLSKTTKALVGDECQFAYRDSIFKQSIGQHWIIESVDFVLRKSSHVNLSYRALSAYIEQQYGTQDVSPQNVFSAVCSLRQSKLPDVNILGNVGSFFKNPIISLKQANTLHEKFPNLVMFPTDQEQQVKLAAAWLIDQCGWKGKRYERVGVYDKQALVLVNYGGSGEQVMSLAGEIKRSVLDKFSVALEVEPKVL